MSLRLTRKQLAALDLLIEHLKEKQAASPVGTGDDATDAATDVLEAVTEVLADLVLDIFLASPRPDRVRTGGRPIPSGAQLEKLIALRNSIGREV